MVLAYTTAANVVAEAATSAVGSNAMPCNTNTNRRPYLMVVVVVVVVIMEMTRVTTVTMITVTRIVVTMQLDKTRTL